MFGTCSARILLYKHQVQVLWLSLSSSFISVLQIAAPQAGPATSTPIHVPKADLSDSLWLKASASPQPLHQPR